MVLGITNKMKRQPAECEKVFANYISDKELMEFPGGSAG